MARWEREEGGGEELYNSSLILKIFFNYPPGRIPRTRRRLSPPRPAEKLIKLISKFAAISLANIIHC